MTLEQMDQTLATWMKKHSDVLLRLGLGLVFIWFGAPKLVPGLSPAEDLVRRAVPYFDPSWFVPTLGLAEVLIGVCLLNRRLLRVGLVLMAGHMAGACLPLITLPDVVWRSFPVATLEGQYILKNIVLIAAAMVLGGSAAQERRPDRLRVVRSDSLPGALASARSRLLVEHSEPA